MELKWLHDFVSLANTGNFSRAAEERNVTQSAFSRRIQSLESWLGAELVDRSAHPVHLTDAGIQFLRPAKNMIRQAERVKEEFAEPHRNSRQTLNFTSSTNLAISFLPEWLTTLQKSVDPFDIKVQTDISGIHDHFEALRTSQSDFLLHYGQGIAMLAMDAGKFEYHVVGEDLLMPVCHRDLAKAHDVTGVANDGSPLPYISPWRTSSIAYLVAEKIALTQPTIRLDTVAESSIVGCTKGFVEQGLGVAWLPSSSIAEELHSGEFVRIFDASFEIPLSIQIYRYASNNRTVAARFWNQVVQQKKVKCLLSPPIEA